MKNEAQLPTCAATMVRMGHPTAIAAATFGQDIPIEIALLPPSVAGEWSVTNHYGCDPENPDRGSSGMAGYDSRAEAETAFRETMTELREDRKFIRYCAKGSDKHGKDVWIEWRDVGLAFADRLSFEALGDNVKGMRTIAGNARKMNTYHRGESMDLKSFAVHRVDISVKEVELADDTRILLAARDVPAPEGWTYLVGEKCGERFIATRKGFGFSDDIATARGFRSLAEAVSALDAAMDENRSVSLGVFSTRVGKAFSEGQVVLARMEMQSTPVPKPLLDEIEAVEKHLAVLERTPSEPDRLEPGTFKPFG